MEFHYLAIVNVSDAYLTDGESKPGKMSPRIWCHAVTIAWGDWYNKSPFNGGRDMRFLSYGGIDVGDIGISSNTDVFVKQSKAANYKLVESEPVKLTEDFCFDKDTSHCTLIVNDTSIKIGKNDGDQPFKLISYKDWTAPHGSVVEGWISPYIREPNRPYIQWKLNPNRL